MNFGGRSPVREGLNLLGAFVLSLVPIAYLLGYVVWGFYSVRLGTGYLPVGHERYLAAGLTMLGAFVVLLLFGACGRWFADVVALGGFWYSVFQTLLLIVSLFVLSRSFGSLFGLDDVILSPEIRGRFMFGFGAALLTGFVVRLVKVNFRVRESTVRWGPLVASGAVLLALLAVSWGQGVLPFVAQEFGGGAPECAVLFVPRLHQEYNETAELFGYILYRDDNWFVFVEEDSESLSPSLIDADEVMGLSWCFDGRYPTVRGPYPNLPSF